MVSSALQGVFKSLRMYHGPHTSKASMDALYRGFIRPGDLVIDVGAHAGDRVSSFRRLGARVIALEPQPLMFRALRLIHGRDASVVLLPKAASNMDGKLTLRINSNNPTVSTASSEFVANAIGKAGWLEQIWDAEITVESITLDAVIQTYGYPSFIKIDVEGFELAVLEGLSTPIPALSFEFTTIARDVAVRCLARLSTIETYGFDFARGESQALTFRRWVSALEMANYIRDLPHAANSGDIYARRLDAD